MNNVGGNLPVVIDPLSKLIGYREVLYIFYPGGYLLSETFSSPVLAHWYQNLKKKNWSFDLISALNLSLQASPSMR